MTLPPMPLKPTRKSVSLAKLATILAVTFLVAFGLCSVNVVKQDMFNNSIRAVLFGVALVAEAICAVGLVVVGVVAMVRSARRKE
jgi:hypothetical protein